MRNKFQPRLALAAACATLSLFASCKVQLPEYKEEADAGKSPGGSENPKPQTSAKPEASESSASPNASTPPVSSSAPKASETGESATVTPSATPPKGAASSTTTASAPETTTPVPPTSMTAPPAASTAVPATKDVNGRVIDYYRRPLSGVDVTIGSAKATTDKDGKFSIPNVADTYTVDFKLNPDGLPGKTFAWRYIGLTRRDPTLQSFDSNLTEREAKISITSDLDPNSTDEVGASVGILSAARSSTVSPGTDSLTPRWNGPTPVTAKAHALVKHKTGEDVTGFGAYISQDFSLAEDATVPWDMKLKDGTAVAPLNLTGSVSVAAAEMRYNSVLAIFDNLGAIVLHDGVKPKDASFTYLVPSIPNSSILVSARNDANVGLWSTAYAYKSGLAAGQTGVTLAIPAFPKLKTPELSGVASPSTAFTWTADASVCVVWIRDNDDPSHFYFTVTSKKSLTTAELLAEPLRKGGAYAWEVETHRTCASLDECAGPEGVLDPVYQYEDSGLPLAPVTGSGTGSWSGLAQFSAAP